MAPLKVCSDHDGTVPFKESEHNFKKCSSKSLCDGNFEKVPVSPQNNIPPGVMIIETGCRPLGVIGATWNLKNPTQP